MTVNKELLKALKASLLAMELAVHFREKGRGRPPEQTCMLEIEQARAAIAAAETAVSEPDDLMIAYLKGKSDGARTVAAVSEPVAEQAAYDMGAKGAEPTEQERLLFEAWMRGHCWKVSGEWDGKQYRHPDEVDGTVNYPTMHTRQLWAVWRDRAALATQPTTAVSEPVMYGLRAADGRYGNFAYSVKSHAKAAVLENPVKIGYKVVGYYTTPPAAPLPEPLSDDQYFAIGQKHWLASSKIMEIERDIKAAHGIGEKRE